jgi:hypothetical protein
VVPFRDGQELVRKDAKDNEIKTAFDITSTKGKHTYLAER